MLILPPVKSSSFEEKVCKMDAMASLNYAGVNALMMDELKKKYPSDFGWILLIFIYRRERRMPKVLLQHIL